MKHNIKLNHFKTKFNYSPLKDNKREDRSRRTPQDDPQRVLHPRTALRAPWGMFGYQGGVNCLEKPGGSVGVCTVSRRGLTVPCGKNHLINI